MKLPIEVMPSVSLGGTPRYRRSEHWQAVRRMSIDKRNYGAELTNCASEVVALWEKMSPSSFRRALSNVPTSVVVASGLLDGEPVGMVIGTFSTISMEPPLVGFFGDHRSSTLEPLLKCENLTFSLLGQDDLNISEAFRLPLSERFNGIPWSISQYGTPMIDTAVLVVHTKLYRVFDAGDHKCVLAEVIDIRTSEKVTRPLVFHKHHLSRLDPGKLLDDEMWQLGWHEPG